MSTAGLAECKARRDTFLRIAVHFHRSMQRSINSTCRTFLLKLTLGCPTDAGIGAWRWVMSNGTRCEGTFFLLVVQRFHDSTGRNVHRWGLLGLAPSAFCNTAVRLNHI